MSGPMYPEPGREKRGSHALALGLAQSYTSSVPSSAAAFETSTPSRNLEELMMRGPSPDGVAPDGPAPDGAAPDENDWAYALRWTAPSGVGAATVLAAMQAAADSDGIEPGAASDGQQHPHAQRRTPSLGDASALAAAARRAVSYRGKVAPEAANSAAEPQAGVESAVTAAVATAATGATAGTAAGAAAASSPPPGAAGAASTTSRRGFHRRSVST